MKRSSGVLMHISSLPGAYSTGGFSESAKQFIDILHDAGFSYWQTLPFCMVDEYNSPYKSSSAFAGNPYFIDLTKLCDMGLITKLELIIAEQENEYACEYKRLAKERIPLLKFASERADDALRAKISEFITENEEIEKYCRFMALKEANDDAPWQEWKVLECDEESIFPWQFMQYFFSTQWAEIKAYANGKGIKIIGDIPIYVSLDSCDVCEHKDEFYLDENNNPTVVAGCPPDYFAKDGQLWGNPIYNWEAMKKDGFLWWQKRMKHMLNLFDGVRIDHFRGLESYWSIPASAKTAKEGKWVIGPGREFIDMLHAVAGDKLIIAEDLGDITDGVRELLEYSGFPGMRVMQFGFIGEKNSPHAPHNYIKNCVAYSGTHDNNTLLGYVWESDEENRRELLDYCGFTEREWNCHESYDKIIRTIMSSVADIVIFPVQDILLYGADTRMNRPGESDGNWSFRLTDSQMKQIDTKKFRKLNELYCRINSHKA